MITFQPDILTGITSEQVETALFLGVRGDPPLESTQIRWQVRAVSDPLIQLETGESLQSVGGALFLTTREPKLEVPPESTPPAIGWLRWIANAGRRSFQIQLAISRVGFDRVCDLAHNARYPHAILTFQEDSGIGAGHESDPEKRTWSNVQSKVALIGEFTLRYDLALP